ncbi:MAG: hypothetical protein AB7I41_22195 [Candidatus Sericytochromatia bacterium]
MYLAEKSPRLLNMSEDELIQAGLRDYRQIPLLFGQERWQEALALIEALQIQLENLPAPEKEQHWTGLKGALMQLQAAEQDLAWQISPSDQLRCWQAQCLHHLGQTAAAMALLREQLSEHPRAELFHLLSRYLLFTGDSEAAVLALNQALQADIYYLPAYEDLTYLAHLHHKYEVSFHLLQMGLSLGYSERLMEEWALACSQPEAEPFRTLFLDLILPVLDQQRLPICLKLVEQLYLQAEYEHSEFLSYHLLTVFPENRDVLNLHLLAAMQLAHWGPVIGLIKTKLKLWPDDRGLWYRLAIAYSRWNMPLLARHALAQVLAETPQAEPELKELAQSLLEALPDSRSLDAFVEELLKESVLEPGFAQAILSEPEKTLAGLGISWNEELDETLKKVFF